MQKAVPGTNLAPLFIRQNESPLAMNQNRDRGVCQHLGSLAAQHGTTETAVPVRCHIDEIALFLLATASIALAG